MTLCSRFYYDRQEKRLREVQLSAPETGLTDRQTDTQLQLCVPLESINLRGSLVFTWGKPECRQTTDQRDNPQTFSAEGNLMCLLGGSQTHLASEEQDTEVSLCTRLLGSAAPQALPSCPSFSARAKARARLGGEQKFGSVQRGQQVTLG